MGVPYKYKNHLSFCPECGKELKETDYDCPGCGVNLVGYNELKNRANNYTVYKNTHSDRARILICVYKNETFYSNTSTNI